MEGVRFASRGMEVEVSLLFFLLFKMLGPDFTDSVSRISGQRWVVRINEGHQLNSLVSLKRAATDLALSPVAVGNLTKFVAAAVANLTKFAATRT